MGQHAHIALETHASKLLEFKTQGRWTGSAPATCGVGGQGSQSLAAALHFSDRKPGTIKQICVLGCLRETRELLSQLLSTDASSTAQARMK